jgi:hypothetical protein
MPRVSIITPTINRQDLLPALWDCVRAQSVEDIEWLVFDSSPQSAPMFDAIEDPRVCYRHVPDSMTIGAPSGMLYAMPLKGRSSLISTTTISMGHVISRGWYR